MNKILFITHEAGRTGAPLIVLYFMKWLKLNCSDIEIHCLSLKSGDLSKEFEGVSKQFFEIENTKDSLAKKVIYKLKKTTKKVEYRKRLLAQLEKENYNIIYANSIMSLDYGIDIKRLFPNTKLVLHLHELNVNVNLYAPNFTETKVHVDKYICASKLVEKNLLNNHNISKAKTEIIYEYSDLKSIITENEELLSYKKFTVGASGSVNLRKGYDLFLCVAKEIKERNIANVEFNWIGKFSNEKTRLEVEADVKKGGLEDMVFFKGEFENPETEFKKFDIFLMTSREDPFPLVCIEVGNLGKPIICFKGATGTEEILSEGGGKIVPYLSINKMADEVINYMINPNEVEEDGLEAHKRFKDFTIENQSPKIYNVIKELI